MKKTKRKVTIQCEISLSVNRMTLTERAGDKNLIKFDSVFDLICNSNYIWLYANKTEIKTACQGAFSGG